MKTVIRHSLRLAGLAAVLALAPATALAQKSAAPAKAQPKPEAQPKAQPKALAETQALAPPPSKLQIENLEALASKADHVVDVTLDENLLKIIPSLLLKSKDPDAQKVARIAAGFKGVYVRSFQFGDAGQWKESDVAGIRAQLRQPGWSKIVSVLSRKDGQNVEVYLMTDPASFGGLAVLATEPTELTVVNIVGRINLEDLLTLEGHLGIPDLDIQIGDSKDDRKADAKPAPPAKKP